ncbi:hypothetical protein LOZ80_14040 [Paenibacillus sp. HWE-109]|uniref:HEPN domain-containing protein n=1 Tax=Paenibacillus sp. HWE-109 TaxID=1306526 RepID=UPI001EDCBCCF|nr:HEPN domain-containing protein [Paenibacillus sp. HWE-109]UKS29988.1 hypothetical protein LOZ80_14040 [Paenibacillus sp. HWE-109]
MIYDGFAFFSENRSIPLHYENGFLKLYLDGSHFTFENNTRIVYGQKRGEMVGGGLLFHFALPLENYGVCQTMDETGATIEVPISFGTVKQQVDFFIDDYVENASYTKMIFSFEELNYFIPSSSMCKYSPKDRHVEFSGSSDIITSFPFKYKGRTVTFSLKLSSSYQFSNRCLAETVSHLTLEFDETDDLEFIQSLYYLVQNLFSFLSNRKNISINNAVLVGKRLRIGCVDPQGNVIFADREVPVTSTFYVFDKYQEEPEESKEISKTIQYGSLAPAFENLLSLFLDNKVSSQSIHSSSAARRLLDLKQCLQITAAFEYYQRTFLPEISSLETIQVYDEVRALIDNYITEQKGEKKKKAKRLRDSLRPTVSLQDKICKVYNGYNNWSGLKFILSEYFGDDVTKLASIANQWRNELAHEKREHEPDQDVISSVRLVEHLNYCIVLRLAEYSDQEIKAIIDKILSR